MTLADLCTELNNWFDCYRYFDTFEITNGEIDLSGLASRMAVVDGQYFRVVGSKFNDGVYKHPATGMVDETFSGGVWVMAVPPAVLTLLNDIIAWRDKYENVVDSPFSSESFGGYSYSKSYGQGASSSSTGVTWVDRFANRLNRWRKIRSY